MIDSDIAYIRFLCYTCEGWREATENVDIYIEPYGGDVYVVCSDCGNRQNISE